MTVPPGIVWAGRLPLYTRYLYSVCMMFCTYISYLQLHSLYSVLEWMIFPRLPARGCYRTVPEGERFCTADTSSRFSYQVQQTAHERYLLLFRYLPYLYIRYHMGNTHFLRVTCRKHRDLPFAYRELGSLRYSSTCFFRKVPVRNLKFEI